MIGQDDDWCRAISKRCREAGVSLVPFTMQDGRGAGLWLREHSLIERDGHGHETVYPLAGIATLRGVHNAQNAAAAIACLRALGVESGVIAEGLKTFPGLAHRMEVLGHIGPVLVINDSKATNADSAAKALASYPRDLYWIIGGVAKEGGIASLAAYFDRLAHVYLIGKAAPFFKTQLPATVPVTESGTLDQAFADQFLNFEVRGARFRALAEAERAFVPFGQPIHNKQEASHGITH